MNVEEMINRPIAEWTLPDLTAISSASIPESQKLEFKADFALGSQEKWRTRQEQVSSGSRDALAEELVAFANAFGGMLLLGVREEKQDDGRRVSAGLGDPIPRVAECVDRLESSLRDVIDPPLSMLEVHPIPSGDDGSGYIAIKVPQSLSAPHGVGRPARAFVRRGASCEPMTMRDLQHVFWEARTAIDRVNNVFDRRHLQFESAVVRRHVAPSVPPHVFFRITIVPTLSYQITRLPLVIGAAPPLGFDFRPTPFLTHQPSMLTLSAPNWRPRAGGMSATQEDGRGTSRELTIWTDGTLELTGIHMSSGDGKLHFPGWYAVGGVWLLFNSMRFRRHLGRIEVPLTMEAELRASKDGQVVFSDTGQSFDGDSAPAPRIPVLTDRLQLGRDAEFDEVAQLFAEQIGWACGIRCDFSGLRLGPNIAV
ncbi:ATP-binding protein [Mesorhizobium sp. Mes31]|uniref:AlbA family DNA-binding domain-containing protein n=1 Tax=Mesorhizobium sp. Mes31 TaxID=2926017 RepID=UPI002118D251|nr:ATP-binding protein [Mesorhizobium sp. Mes31]